MLRERFEREYKNVEKSLFLIAIGYLHNTEDAKDAVQEAVLSAYQSFHKLKHILRFMGICLKIVTEWDLRRVLIYLQWKRMAVYALPTVIKAKAPCLPYRSIKQRQIRRRQRSF